MTLTKATKEQIGKIKQTYSNISVSQLLDQEEKLKFDLSIQRSEVWSQHKKSMLIHSMIYGYPVPPIYAQESEDENLWFLDGKQRLTSCIAYCKNGFPLTKIPSIGDFDLTGLSFDELPIEMQKAILNHSFMIFTYKNITDEERNELFIRLNSGESLRKQELNRVLVSDSITSIINSLKSEPFFAKSIAITANNRKRFVDEEIIMQIIALLNNNYNLGSESIKSIATSLRELPKETIKILRTTTKYLNDAFPTTREKFLKRVNIPMVFLMASKALEQEIPANKFAGWTQQFFNGLDSESVYSVASSQGSARKENVQKRLEAIEKDFLDNIDTASDYVPTQSESRRKRQEQTA